jgi:hypothetical protein
MYDSGALTFNQYGVDSQGQGIGSYILLVGINPANTLTVTEGSRLDVLLEAVQGRYLG